MSSLAVDIEHI